MRPLFLLSILLLGCSQSPSSQTVIVGYPPKDPCFQNWIHVYSKEAAVQKRARQRAPAHMQASWDGFRRRNGNDWEVRWNEITCYAERVSQGRTERYSGNLSEAGEAFLGEEAEIFGLKGDGMSVANIGARPSIEKGKTLQFQVRYKGLDVFQWIMHVSFDDDQRIIEVTGSARPVHVPDIRPKLAPAQAAALLRKEHGELTNLLVAPRLLIYPEYPKGGAWLAYESEWGSVRSSENPCGNSLLYITDAMTGKVLRKSEMGSCDGRYS